MTEKKQTFEERVGMFQDLEKSNSSAITSLLAIRTSIQDGYIGDVTSSYNTLVESIINMARNYGKMGGRDYQDCYKKLLELEETSWGELERACFGTLFGEQKEKRIAACDVLDKLDSDQIGSSADCDSLHKMVRYLHGAGLNSLFNGEGMDEQRETVRFNSGKFYLFRRDNGKCSDILEEMFKLYKNGTQKKGEEEYNLILTEKILLSRIKLGCHLSNLDATIDGNNSSVTLRFSNTKESQYPNAPYRAQYVEKILSQFGFQDIQTKGIITLGIARDIKRKKLPKLFGDLTRLLASTKDLDVNGSQIKGRVDEAVKVFLGGKTNIIHYLTNT